MRIFFAILIGLIFNSCNFKERNGEEIFYALFDQNEYPSLEVTNFQDQKIVDCCLWLLFTMKPADMSSFLKANKVEFKLVKNDSTLFPTFSETPDWWHQAELGPEILYGEVDIVSEDRIQFFYMSKDSSAVYFYDFVF